MKTLFPIAAVVFMVTIPGIVGAVDYSAQVEITIGRVYAFGAADNPPGWPTAIVTVKNNSPYTLSDIYVKCAFLKDGLPISTGVGHVKNLAPGAVGTDTVRGPQDVFDKARCRVSSACRSLTCP